MAKRRPQLAGSVATDVAGHDRVELNVDAMMGGEDFAYMLQAKPGAYAFHRQWPFVAAPH